MRSGGCLCGAVRYVVRGPVRDVLVCHCVECRRWTGRSWSATAARRDELDILAADELRWVVSPDSESDARRGFCSRCGSCLFWDAPGRRTVSISVGSLDDAGDLEVVAHVWIVHALAWELPTGPTATYARGYPPDGAVLDWRP